jgi:hypothetical protein
LIRGARSAVPTSNACSAKIGRKQGKADIAGPAVGSTRSWVTQNRHRLFLHRHQNRRFGRCRGFEFLKSERNQCFANSRRRNAQIASITITKPIANKPQSPQSASREIFLSVRDRRPGPGPSNEKQLSRNSTQSIRVLVANQIGSLFHIRRDPRCRPPCTSLNLAAPQKISRNRANADFASGPAADHL